jgi:hypothetical protein
MGYGLWAMGYGLWAMGYRKIETPRVIGGFLDIGAANSP